jgi:hypothetical protein
VPPNTALDPDAEQCGQRHCVAETQTTRTYAPGPIPIAAPAVPLSMDAPDGGYRLIEPDVLLLNTVIWAPIIAGSATPPVPVTVLNCADSGVAVASELPAAVTVAVEWAPGHKLKRSGAYYSAIDLTPKQGGTNGGPLLSEKDRYRESHGRGLTLGRMCNQLQEVQLSPSALRASSRARWWHTLFGRENPADQGFQQCKHALDPETRQEGHTRGGQRQGCDQVSGA